MSVRDDIWELLGECGALRADVIGHFESGRHENVRKALHRYTKTGEFVRDGDVYRRGARPEIAFRPWRCDEDGVVIAFAHEGYEALSARLPGRTRSAIRQRCQALGRGPRPTQSTPAKWWPAYTSGHLSPAVGLRCAA